MRFVLALGLAVTSPLFANVEATPPATCADDLVPRVVLKNVPYGELYIHYSFMPPLMDIALPESAVLAGGAKASRFLHLDDMMREPARGWLISATDGIVQLEGIGPRTPLRDASGAWQTRVVWHRSDVLVGPHSEFYRSADNRYLLWVDGTMMPLVYRFFDLATGATVEDLPAQSVWEEFGIHGPRTLAALKAMYP